MRGAALKNSLFSNTMVVALPTPERKGRNEAELQKRDRLMMIRYVYYCLFFPQYTSEYIIAEKVAPVSGYLLPDTIGRKLCQMATELRQLRNQKPDRKWFKEEYPHIVWE